MKIDPIIAVDDVKKAALWYEKIFNLKLDFSNEHFANLLNKLGETELCLHKWSKDGHHSMQEKVLSGNGLILFFRTDEMGQVYNRAVQNNCKIEELIHQYLICHIQPTLGLVCIGLSTPQ